MLSLACIGQDPCKNVTCGTVCRGVDLWEQRCLNGECVDYSIIEKNSRECGYNPCKDVVCTDSCFGTELWKMKCVEGECVQDFLIEKDSERCGFIPPSPTPMPPGEIETEEYAVYTALIETRFDLIATFREPDEVKLIVIEEYTSSHSETPEELASTLQWVDEKLSGLQKETIEDFKMKNAQPYLLEDRFNLKKKVAFISRKQMEEIFSNGGWNEFYQKYPFSQGIMTLSRVGFNSTRDQALVYVGNQCDWL